VRSATSQVACQDSASALCCQSCFLRLSSGLTYVSHSASKLKDSLYS
jgi:hypothetical protein